MISQENNALRNTEQNPARKADYRLEQFDDELLLYHPQETKIIQFNPSASLIWGLCNGERCVEEIIALLAEIYPESSPGIAEDVRITVQQFDQLGCLEWV